MQNNKIKYKHPFTVWEYIKKDIEIMIIINTLKTGDKVPSINQLAQDYNVSNSTAQKALETLNEEGIITKQRGVGYFVKPYTREKLKNKHKIEFEKSIDKVISLARHLEISKEKITNIIEEKIDQTYSP